MNTPDPIYAQYFPAFELNVGAPPLQNIAAHIELLASDSVTWLGTAQIGGKPQTVMAHKFNFDDEAPSGTAALTSLVSPTVDVSGDMVRDPALLQKASGLYVDGFEPCLNFVNVPALMASLQKKYGPRPARFLKIQRLYKTQQTSCAIK